MKNVNNFINLFLDDRRQKPIIEKRKKERIFRQYGEGFMRTRTMKYQKNEIKNATNLGDIQGIDLFFQKVVVDDLKTTNKNEYKCVDLNDGKSPKKVKVKKRSTNSNSKQNEALKIRVKKNMLNTTYNINSLTEDLELKNTLMDYRKTAIKSEFGHDAYTDHLVEKDFEVNFKILKIDR